MPCLCRRYCPPIVSCRPAPCSPRNRRPRPPNRAPTFWSASAPSAIPANARFFERLAGALADLPFRSIITAGPSIDPAGLAAASHVQVRRFVPHAELLPGMRLVVGHGGHGTTMAALAHDVPVLILPMSGYADHVLVGDAVTRAGAGAVVSKRATRPELLVAIRSLLESRDVQLGAARLGQQIRSRRGAATAAQAIVALVPD